MIGLRQDLVHAFRPTGILADGSKAPSEVPQLALFALAPERDPPASGRESRHHAIGPYEARDDGSQPSTFSRMCSITSLCSFCGLNITMSVFSSALTLCPGGQ